MTKRTNDPKQAVVEKFLPWRFSNSTFENFVERPGTEKALSFCKQYVGKFDMGATAGLFIFGPAGCGKTHLACATAVEIAAKAGIKPTFAPTTYIANSVRGSNDQGATIVNNLIETPLLILDDLGSEDNTRQTQEVLYMILDGRYLNGGATIVTTPCDAAEIQTLLGTLLVSRLYGMCIPVEMTATDYRAEVHHAAAYRAREE